MRLQTIQRIVFGEGWVYHFFIYLFMSAGAIEWQLMLCYNSTAPSTCRNDISASAICHLQRFSLVNWCIGRPTQVSSAALVAYSVFFILLSCIVSTVNDSEVVDCTHELTLISSCDLFSRLKKTLCAQSACKIKLITYSLIRGQLRHHSQSCLNFESNRLTILLLYYY